VLGRRATRLKGCSQKWGKHACYLFRSSHAYLSLHGRELELYAEVIILGMCFDFRAEMRLVRILFITSNSYVLIPTAPPTKAFED
jgi:hypothetical protein